MLFVVAVVCGVVVGGSFVDGVGVGVVGAAAAAVGGGSYLLSL